MLDQPYNNLDAVEERADLEGAEHFINQNDGCSSVGYFSPCDVSK